MKVGLVSLPVEQRRNRTSPEWPWVSGGHPLHCKPVERSLSAPGSNCARVLALLLLLALPLSGLAAAASGHTLSFPPPLDSYPEPANPSLWETLTTRAKAEPFNLVATGIFFLAIVHTFMASRFMAVAHRHQHTLKEMLARNVAKENQPEVETEPVTGLRFKAEFYHFLGEVEAIFGIWVVPLLVIMAVEKGWPVARDYIGYGLNFTEPMFVVVIMAMAASRPILNLAERLMAAVAWIGRGTPAAWWLSILTIGPLLGSFITEPAAMTISALLLGRKFYEYGPSKAMSYATIGLLFVNVSVGGTLTHFAAPPVLMVAGKWGWGLGHMLQHFGWKAALGIVLANSLYLLVFFRELKRLKKVVPARRAETGGSLRIPWWVTGVHLLFLGWTVMNNHFPALFIGGFLFFLAFTRASEEFQDEVSLRSPMLVGFFLAGLVIHGGLQGWWIAPTLSGLAEKPLFFGAALLTAFNDNAAITYLASLVPGFTDAMKHAVVAGAVVGGGLTVIANAPNPAGQSILSKYFPDGVSAPYLFLGAALPTAIVGTVFLLFR